MHTYLQPRSAAGTNQTITSDRTRPCHVKPTVTSKATKPRSRNLNKDPNESDSHHLQATRILALARSGHTMTTAHAIQPRPEKHHAYHRPPNPAIPFFPFPFPFPQTKTKTDSRIPNSDQGKLQKPRAWGNTVYAIRRLETGVMDR